MSPFFLCPLSVFNFAYLLFPIRSSKSRFFPHPLLNSSNPSPNLLRTSGLIFITAGCTDKRISHLRLQQSCHVRSVKISGGGLGGRKPLKVSHKNIFIQAADTRWREQREAFKKVSVDSVWSACPAHVTVSCCCHWCVVKNEAVEKTVVNLRN